MIGAVITMVGAGIILISAIGHIRFGPLAKEYRPRPFWRPRPGRRQVGQWLRGLEPIPPEELPRLRAVAWARVGQRWTLLVCLGASLAEGGTRVGRTNTMGLLLVGGYIAFMALAAVVIERKARIGAAFLRRYPPPERTEPISYPSPPQPGSV